MADNKTGLANNDVFYFGNARGDVTPRASFPTIVSINAFDVNQLRARQGTNSLRPFTAPSLQTLLASSVPPLKEKLSAKGLEAFVMQLEDGFL